MSWRVVPDHGQRFGVLGPSASGGPQKGCRSLRVLEMLELHGCIVTTRSLTNRAMGCQREIAQRITQGGADYVLAVKENQGQLHEGIRDLFEGAEALGFDGVPYDHTETVDKGHGLAERRECWGIADQDGLDYLDPQGQWPQLKAAIRSHWSIENSLHWTLDVTFREDQCRVRKDNGPQNINTLRQIGHNLLKNETTLKVGIQGKRLNAGWDENYLLKVLLG